MPRLLCGLGVGEIAGAVEDTGDAGEVEPAGNEWTGKGTKK